MGFGECVVHDRGSEFCNKVVQKLFENFKTRISVVRAGRPQGNGQAEIFVKSLKTKMKCLMLEKNYRLPKNWDDLLLHKSLQILRTDPSVAHGYAPAEIILGRKIIYPLELKKKEIDLTGKNLLY